MNQSLNRPFLVALTGGIASGKTAVQNEFAALGVPVIDTDQIARDVVLPGSATLKEIVGAFGSEVLNPDGTLDRRHVREIVFADAGERKRLEAITHPAIRAELARRSSERNAPYQIHAIPLFAEGGGKGRYDRVLVVDCPESLQIERLMARDSVNAEQARLALAAQATRADRLALATDVIDNTGSVAELAAKVAALHKEYLALAAHTGTTPSRGAGQ